MKKKDKKELVDKIALGIAIVLKESNEQAARKIRKHIVAAAKEVVKRFSRQLPETDPTGPQKPKKADARKSVKAAGAKTSGKKSIVAVKKKAVRKKTVKRVRRK